MHTLRDLQRRCYDAFVHGAGFRLEPFLAGTAPAAAVAVYRNNVLEIARKALQAAYPVVQRLCGDACFRTICRDYLARHPSPSGNLDRFGAGFPGFLDHQYGGGPFDYFSHVARLEWACEEAWAAAEPRPLELTALGAVPASRAGELIVEMQPACRLVSSRYPVLSIWRANSEGDGTVSLDAGAENVLVGRIDGRLELRSLAPTEAAFLGAVLRGERLAGACDAATAAGDGFDPGALLRDLAAGGLLAGAALPQTSSQPGSET